MYGSDRSYLLGKSHTKPTPNLLIKRFNLNFKLRNPGRAENFINCLLQSIVTVIFKNMWNFSFFIFCHIYPP